MTFLLTPGMVLHRNVWSGGQLAQLVEHRLHTAGVTGSSPVLPTKRLGAVVKSVITPACHAGGRGFKSLPLRQKVEEESVKWLLFFFLVPSRSLSWQIASASLFLSKVPSRKIRASYRIHTAMQLAFGFAHCLRIFLHLIICNDCPGAALPAAARSFSILPQAARRANPLLPA